MLTKEHIDYRSHDREIWESELESWVPQRVYDCHMHMLDNSLIAEGTFIPTPISRRPRRGTTWCCPDGRRTF